MYAKSLTWLGYPLEVCPPTTPLLFPCMAPVLHWIASSINWLWHPGGLPGMPEILEHHQITFGQAP